MSETRTLPLAETFSAADTVTVTDNLNLPYGTVSDHPRIASVLAWLQEREDGWYEPAGGTRVSRVRVNFTGGGTALGNLGLGPKYLTALHRGRWFQRDADPGDREAVLALLGVEVTED
jgi:hypothetical protein